jgi:hypothetical protein
MHEKRKDIFIMALSSLYGVKIPKGVQTEDELMRLQSTVGVPATGVWDFSSQAAYEKYLRRFGVPLTTAYQVEGYAAPGMVRNQRDVKIMQEALGNVTVDGIWGPETDGAYKARIGAENGPANASSLPISSGAEIAARIAERLDQISSNTGNKSVPVPVVDSKASLPYTGSGSIPKVQPYQQTITQALIRPAASATAARTTNAGNKPDLGKQPVKSRPIVKPSEFMPNAYTDTYGEYPRSYGAARPVTDSQPSTDHGSDAGRTRTPKDEDTSKGVYEPFSLSLDKDSVIEYASSVLNITTARENKEACCNLYSVVIDGKKYYFTGEIFVGELDNVIEPYLTDALWELEDLFVDGLLDLKYVKYEGFMHSHPYYSGSDQYSGGIGDTGVAMLSGNIYLTTPTGNIYDLTRPDDLLQNFVNAADKLSLLELLFLQNTDTDTYSAALSALKNWFNDPPEVPYNDLHSIDTTNTSINNEKIDHNIPKVIMDIIQRYWEKEYGPLGFDLYEATQKFGSDFIDILSQLNLYI